MIARPVRQFLIPVLLACFGLMLASRAPAQIYTNLHSFGGSGDGYGLVAGLVLSGNTLYGTTQDGGAEGGGTLFAINTDGTGYIPNLVSFGGFQSTNGNTPDANLVLVGNTLYGTTEYGGAPDGNYQNYGVVFSVGLNGMVSYMVLHSFMPASSDGEQPYGGLVFSGSALYGTTYTQGAFNSGTIYSINGNVSGYSTIYNFTATTYLGNGISTNSDGANPQAGLIFSGNTLYGTAFSGGTNGYGTVFAVNTSGTNFMTLHTFAGSADGAKPIAGLVLSGNTLYGVTPYGGTNGYGTVFAVNTNGSNFMTLHTFAVSDGANPQATLVLSGKTLYGTTPNGGRGGLYYAGTVFAINTDGSGFTTIYNFTNLDGWGPNGLVLSGNTLYGTTQGGGAGGDSENSGTVFSLTVPITLQITSIVRTNVTDLLITWNTSGTNNIVQVTLGTGPSGSFSTNGFTDLTNLVVTTLTTNFWDVGAATNYPARYYRIHSPQ